MPYAARQKPSTKAHSRRKRLAPDARRSQLLACAMTVFARRGLGRAGHAEIAREAGVSVSTVFVYFPTREALVEAVLEEVARFLVEMARTTHDASHPAPEVLKAHVRAFTDSADSRPDYVRVWLDWSTAIREDVWPRYLELQDQVVEIVVATIVRGQREESIAADVDPASDARLLIGSAHMLAQMKFTHQAAEDVDRFIETLVRATLGKGGRGSAR